MFIRISEECRGHEVYRVEKLVRAGIHVGGHNVYRVASKNYSRYLGVDNGYSFYEVEDYSDCDMLGYQLIHEVEEFRTRYRELGVLFNGVIIQIKG